MVSSLMTGYAQLATVDYKDGEQNLSGFGIKPQNGLKEKPGVLILPAWMGIDEHSKESAAELAKLGYYAFVADILRCRQTTKECLRSRKKCRLLQAKIYRLPKTYSVGFRPIGQAWCQSG